MLARCFRPRGAISSVRVGPLRFANRRTPRLVERTVPAIARDRQRDLELARAAAGGDADAFTAIVRANADAVLGHCLRFFADRPTAEDATQEIFIKVLRQVSSYDGRAAFSTWLYRLAHNTCLDMVRSAKRRPTPMDPAGMPDVAGADPTPARADADALKSALATLPDAERDAMAAVGLYEMTYPEAARVLGVPVGTVKSRVFRARRTLIAALAEEVEQ